MEDHGGVGGEDLARAAGTLHAQAEVLGRVLGRERTDLEPMLAFITEPRVTSQIVEHIGLTFAR